MTAELTDEGIAFVTDRHLAILSTFDRSGGIHSVPVGFTLEEGVVRIITGGATQKVRNVERGRHATVSQVEGARWVTLVGSATVNRDPDAVAHAVALYAARYKQPRENPERVVIEIAVERVMGSSSIRTAR
jgi:PPOX class probable F420-dependent enzyme